MGSSQSARIKIKQFGDKTAKCLIHIKNNIKKGFNKIFKFNCCLPIIKVKSSEEIVNKDVELTTSKSEKPNVKLINCKLDKKTPSLNNYITNDYIKNKSESNESKQISSNDVSIDLNEPV